MRKSDGVRVHHERNERWGERKRAMRKEFTIRKSDGWRVHNEKERWGETSP